MENSKQVFFCEKKALKKWKRGWTKFSSQMSFPIERKNGRPAWKSRRCRQKNRHCYGNSQPIIKLYISKCSSSIRLKNRLFYLHICRGKKTKIDETWLQVRVFTHFRQFCHVTKHPKMMVACGYLKQKPRKRNGRQKI